MREHWRIFLICPRCGLTRFCNDRGIESDEDCAQPLIRCNKLQRHAKANGVWQMNANRIEREGGEPRETRIRLVNSPSLSDFYESYLYLCDECWQVYVYNEPVSLYDLQGGPP